ncbi:MAG: DUF1641 domain-containing protein [Pirellulaceae bacterium]
MNNSGSQTIEEALFGRMGISVDDAIATATDVVDEKVSSAVASGKNVDERIKGLGDLFERLTEPQTLSALNQLIDALPQLTQMVSLAKEMPNLVAMLGDMFDEYQKRYAADGIDVEKALTNGVEATLFLGSKVDMEHLRRIGDLLASDILNPHALHVVDNAAKSLNSAQKEICGEPNGRVGLFGLLSAIRNPEIQRSLAFAVQFGKCFGKNMDKK